MKHLLSFLDFKSPRPISIRRYDKIPQVILPLGESPFQIGTNVDEGQALSSDLGENLLVHSPFKGSIENIVLHRGQRYYYIRRDFDARPLTYTVKNPLKRPPLNLIETLRMMGAPVWKKTVQACQKIHYIVINAIEIEPLLCADTAIFTEFTKEVLLGAEGLRYACGAKEIIIILPKGSGLKDAVVRLTKGIRRFRIHELALTYPKATPRFILAQLFGKELPSYLPHTELSTEIFSPLELYSAYEALYLGKPHTETTLAVDGPFAEFQGVCTVPLGTPIYSFLRPYAAPESYLMIKGGPFSGVAVNPKMGVDSDTKAILVYMPAVPKTPLDCTNCGLCVETCPVGLNPALLYDMLRHKEFDRAEQYGFKECTACHVCSYVCPSHIPLGRIISRGRDNA
ncbi:MAG: 4Fe-4S dicluster domain-containing protein [Brevinema sp.]